MLILGIESSCDETAAAVIQDGKNILSSITATSAGLHAKTGGVIPEDAARKQIQAIMPVIDLALTEANIDLNKIDALALTMGPGLIGSLLVGVETAKTLAMLHDKKIIPVNHLIGHIYANWLNTDSPPTFPILALVVSGGHTDLVLMTNYTEIKLLGSTRDDAAGEAFDKTARLLGLAYPGGPTLAKLADHYRQSNPNEILNLFPRPMVHENNFDWSFSGLKTAVLTKISELAASENRLKLADYAEIAKSKKVQEQAPKLAAEIQEAVVESLVTKVMRAIDRHKPASFLLAGGVAANSRLREKFVHEFKSKTQMPSFHVPEPKLCTDNAAYIAAAAYFMGKENSWSQITTNPNLRIID